jgi:hypothetical protein
MKDNWWDDVWNTLGAIWYVFTYQNPLEPPAPVQHNDRLQ